jgi:hypothetical protein
LNGKLGVNLNQKMKKRRVRKRRYLRKRKKNLRQLQEMACRHRLVWKRRLA